VKRILLILLVLLFSGIATAQPPISGNSPVFTEYAQLGQYDLYCKIPKGPNTTLCKVFEEVEISEGVFETKFVANAHLWINQEKGPHGKGNWEQIYGIWVRFTPKDRVNLVI